MASKTAYYLCKEFLLFLRKIELTSFEHSEFGQGIIKQIALNDLGGISVNQIDTGQCKGTFLGYYPNNIFCLGNESAKAIKIKPTH